MQENLYANYTVNEDGSTTKAQLKSTEKDSENLKRNRKLIRKKHKDDDILQRVKIAKEGWKLVWINESWKMIMLLMFPKK